MERGCISLMYSMVLLLLIDKIYNLKLTDCFPLFHSLNQELKVAALRVFSNRFTHLDQCYRTVSIFSGEDDTRFVLHYGQYVDANKLEHFFADEQDPTRK